MKNKFVFIPASALGGIATVLLATNLNVMLWLLKLFGFWPWHRLSVH